MLIGFRLKNLPRNSEREKWDSTLELGEIAKSQDRIYSTHLRDEAGEVASALQEAIDLSKQTGVSLQVSHLKVMGEKNWHLMDGGLSEIEKAHKAGVDINFDVYPYTQTGSVLYVYLPAWAAEGGKRMLVKRLKENTPRKKIVEEMRETAGYHYENAVIAVCSFSKSLSNRKIAEIASERGVFAEE